MADTTPLVCSNFEDESVASDTLDEEHTDTETHRESFASAIDDEQSRLFNAAPIPPARAYDFYFNHEISGALDFELRDNAGNAKLSKQEWESKNHQLALKRVGYPKIPRFHLIKLNVYNKSDYGHDETLLESDDESSFGAPMVKKVDHDTSELGLCLLSLHFSGPGDIHHRD